MGLRSFKQNNKHLRTIISFCSCFFSSTLRQSLYFQFIFNAIGLCFSENISSYFLLFGHWVNPPIFQFLGKATSLYIDILRFLKQEQLNPLQSSITIQRTKSKHKDRNFGEDCRVSYQSIPVKPCNCQLYLYNLNFFYK